MGRENVGVVIRPLSLQDRADPFEPHAGVHVPGGKKLEAPVLCPVVLDEHQVPDLHDSRIPGVHQPAPRPVAGKIDMDLRTGAARTGVAHLPEVVLFPEPEDMRRVDVGHGLARARRPRRRSRRPWHRAAPFPGPTPGQQLPGPADRLPLVVIAERPVAEHFEEGVVVGVASDLLQVVVLAATRMHFWVSAARRSSRVPVPRKTSLNWFMPALVNRGSDPRGGSPARSAQSDGRALQKSGETPP